MTFKTTSAMTSLLTFDHSLFLYNKEIEIFTADYDHIKKITGVDHHSLVFGMYIKGKENIILFLFESMLKTSESETIVIYKSSSLDFPNIKVKIHFNNSIKWN